MNLKQLLLIYETENIHLNRLLKSLKKQLNNKLKGKDYNLGLIKYLNFLQNELTPKLKEITVVKRYKNHRKTK